MLFIKGDAVRNIVFKEIPWIRKSNDIDILVPEDKVAYFYNSLQTDLGYTINASASEEIAYRKMFQHCAPLVSENAKIDLHFRITQEGDGYKFDYEDFFKDAEIAESNGIKYQITSKEYTLFCLCYHQFMHEYREGKYMLKMNGDVYNLLDNVAINWNRFIDIVKKQNANFPIYYSLYACNKLYGYYLNSELVPQWVLQELEKEDYVKKFDGIVSRHLFDEEPFGYWKIPYEERIFWDRWDVRKEQVKYFFINEAQKRWKIKAEEMQVPLEDLVALTTQMWINDGNFFKENID